MNLPCNFRPQSDLQPTCSLNPQSCSPPRAQAQAWGHRLPLGSSCGGGFGALLAAAATMPSTRHISIQPRSSVGLFLSH